MLRGDGKARIGCVNTGGAFIGGVIDEFRIYRRCLSDADVKKLSRLG